MNKRKPDWLRAKLQGSEQLYETKKMLKRLSLHTVCEEANCPNLAECFGKKTATFMILGKTCTRNCTFCNVSRELPQAVDPGEPAHVAQAVKELGLRHAVITSVTRDDLPDGGAAHFAAVIREIKELGGNVIIEVLIPDFQGDYAALSAVAEAKPHIINHNLETVQRLYPAVRPQASYSRSLQLLKNVKHLDANIYTKSGLMLGLGEEEEEVLGAMQDLREAGCQILTMGQYLAPSNQHHPVVEYVHPEQFEKYKELGYEMGFDYVASAPLVRSSYQAEEVARALL